MIRLVRASDAQPIAAIYNEYIINTAITFEEQPVAAQEMALRIEEVSAAGLPWYVAESDGRVIGYAYASKWKARGAYRYSVETTVYLDASQKSKGIGSSLYEALLAQLKEQKFHIAIGGIALPNEASVKLHEKFGYEKWRTSKKSASNSDAGWTWVTGRCRYRTKLWVKTTGV